MGLDNRKIKEIFKSLATTEKQNIKDMLLNYSKDEKNMEVQEINDDDSWKKKEVKETLSVVPFNKISEKGYITPIIRDYLLSNYKEPFFSETPFNSETFIFKDDEIQKDKKTACLSVHAIRIVLILSFLLKEKHRKMMQDINQLSLFDHEWFNMENDTVLSVHVKFKYSDFLPKNSKDYSRVRNAIEELYSRKFIVDYPMVVGNKVRRVRASRSLISDYIMDEENMKLVINNYWYRSLVNISKSYYISLNKEAIFNLSERSLLFYIYLNTLPFIDKEDNTESKKVLQSTVRELGFSDISRMRGTIISKNNFLKKFMIEAIWENNKRFNSNSVIEQKLLKPFHKELSRNKLDKNFNYKFEKDNIILVVYELISYEEREKIITTQEAEIKATISYIKKHRELTNYQTIVIVNCVLKYSYNTVIKATRNRKELRNLKGEEYVRVFYNLVHKYIKEKENELLELNKVLQDIDFEEKNKIKADLYKKYPVEKEI